MVLSRSTLTLALWTLAAQQAAAQQVELLDFYLPTCAPCRAMTPTIDRLAAEGIQVRKVDGSRDPRLASRFGVEGYPTFVILVDGVESGRVVGATSEANLRTLLTRAGSGRAKNTRVAAATFSQASVSANRDFTVGPDAGPGMPGPPRSRGPQAAMTSNDSLIDSSVRITVEDPSGRSHGAGTIIDAREGEALVVTCAHLFRDSRGSLMETEGRLSIETFVQSPGGPRVTQRVPASVVVYDFEADVALVRMRPQSQLKVASVAASPGAIGVGDPVRSVGCDLGDDPTVRTSSVVTIDRYNGPPNIETTGAPVQGRSGGGLFNERGELIGVCFAADNEADEGLYAGLASIHAQLDRIGLEELYRGGGAAPAGEPLSIAMASSPPAQPTQHAQPPRTEATLRDSRLEPVAPWPDPVIRGQDPASSSAMTPVERATLEEVTRRSEHSEVVFLIRSHEPGGRTEVLTLDSASPAMVEALRSMAPSGAERR